MSDDGTIPAEETLRKRMLRQANTEAEDGSGFNPDNSSKTMHPAQAYEKNHPFQNTTPLTEPDKRTAYESMLALRKIGLPGLKPLSDEFVEKIFRETG